MRKLLGLCVARLFTWKNQNVSWFSIVFWLSAGVIKELLPAHTSCYQRICARRCCGACTEVLQTDILVESASFQMRSSCASFGQERVERGETIHWSVKWWRWTIFVLHAPSRHVRPQLCVFWPSDLVPRGWDEKAGWTIEWLHHSDRSGDAGHQTWLGCRKTVLCTTFIYVWCMEYQYYVSKAGM